MAKTADQLGAKLGPRIARLVHDANLVAAHKKLGLHHKLGMQLQHDFFRLTGSEIQATLGPMYRNLAAADDMPDWARDTFAFLADGLGQWQTLLGSQVGGQILGQGLGALITNELEPAVAAILAANPAMILPASTAASAAARGIGSAEAAAKEAAFNGVNRDRFDTLVDLNRHDLDPAAVVAALRRGYITGDTAHRMLKNDGYRDESAGLVIRLSRQLLSPAILADAVVRGILEEAPAETLAHAQGLEPADFKLLVADTGEAPALQTLLEAYRRGIINQPRLAHGIRTGRLRNEWIDVAEALRYQPPSAAEAIGGAVQGHLPLAEARAKAENAGLDPREFDWLFQTHGEPIAVGQALSLWNRGVIGEAEVTQVVRESRTKTKYIPAILQLRRHLLPQRTIVSMVSKGALTKTDGVRHLLDLGVDITDATALIGEAHTDKVTHHRALSEATVLELYTDRAITEAHARALLTALGYDGEEVTMILQLHQLRAFRRLQSAAVNVIRSRYVARHIDDQAAAGALDAAQVSADERDQLLALWSLERTTTTRLPTIAELTKAVKANVIDTATWGERLLGLGYGEADLPIMAAAHGVNLEG